MKKFIGENHEEVSKAVAEKIANFINANNGALMCFAGGDTPLRVYELLIEMQQDGSVDLNKAFYVSLDEWVGLGYEDAGSCLQMMRDGFYDKAKIDSSRLCLFNAKSNDLNAEAKRVEAFIEEHGGIALTLLGIGMNGHIGFNEPNGSNKSGVIIVDLDEITCTVGQKYFKTATPVKQGITISYTTLGMAKEIIYMATGERKSEIVRTILSSDKNPNIPATMLADKNSLCFYVDKDAYKNC